MSSTLIRPSWKNYLALCKPKVVALIIFTAVVGMFLASPGFPPLQPLLFGTLGIGLAAASAAAINHFLDQKVDAKMARTQDRPLPQGNMSAQNVISFAISLGVIAMLILVLWVNYLTAALTFLSLIGYAIVYTVYLKHATPQNIVIGGAAGATAPLIADAAVDGTLGSFGWILFLIIFLWTPPHFWAIAIFRRDEYAKAELPMMNLVIGDQKTRKLGLVYTLLMVPASLAPLYFGQLGWAYGAAALLSGAWFTWWNVKAIKAEDRAVDWKMFKASIVYLGLLFAAMIGDFAAGTPGI